MIYILLILLVIVECTYSPRLRMTRERDLLLFYTKGYTRQYVKIAKL